MQDLAQRGALLRTGLLALALSGLGGCVGAGAEGLGIPFAPPLPQAAPADRLWLGETPTGAEGDYLDTTIHALFRRRPAERTRAFVPLADAGLGVGAVCARSRNGGRIDHALVILQRRIVEGPVSQVEDDAVILRGPDDTRLCREQAGDLDWVPVG